MDYITVFILSLQEFFLPELDKLEVEKSFEFQRDIGIIKEALNTLNKAFFLFSFLTQIPGIY